MTRLTYIDLFAGIGGFHQAMDSIGATCVFSSEWDKDCQQTYEENYGIRPHGDITTIHEQDIPAHDVICAGFPCQAFSISGKQLGFADTRGTLFFDIARIAKHHQPRLLVLENVRNFAKHDGGKTLQVVYSTLEEIGYTVFHQLLNASRFGIPQSRERVFIVAFRNDLGMDNFEFPTRAGGTQSLQEYLLPDEETAEFVINRTDIKMKQVVTIERDMFGDYPQKPVRIGIVNKGGQGERIYSPLGHAITLSAYGGGVGAKTGLYLVNGKIRRLAPRECARIMGFPDTFILPARKNVAYRQLGNCVAIPMVRSVLQQVLIAIFLNAGNANG